MHFCFGSDFCASTRLNSIFPTLFPLFTHLLLVTVIIKDPL